MEIGWEDVSEAYKKVVCSGMRVGGAHMSYMELADVDEEGANAAWFGKVKQEPGGREGV